MRSLRREAPGEPVPGFTEMWLACSVMTPGKPMDSEPSCPSTKQPSFPLLWQLFWLALVQSYTSLLLVQTSLCGQKRSLRMEYMSRPPPCYSRLLSISILCDEYFPLESYSTRLSYANVLSKKNTNMNQVALSLWCCLLFYFLSFSRIRGWVTFLDSVVAIWFVNGRKLWLPYLSVSSPFPSYFCFSDPIVLILMSLSQELEFNKSFLICGPCLSSFHSPLSLRSVYSEWFVSENLGQTL